VTHGSNARKKHPQETRTYSQPVKKVPRKPNKKLGGEKKRIVYRGGKLRRRSPQYGWGKVRKRQVSWGEEKRVADKGREKAGAGVGEKSCPGWCRRRRKEKVKGKISRQEGISRSKTEKSERRKKL